MTSSSRGVVSFVPSVAIRPSFHLASAVFLLASACLAQQPALPDAPASQLLAQVTQASPDASPPQASSPEATVTIPAGTRLTLVLTHAVDSNIVRRGDEVFAQTSAPVIVDQTVAIPGGTYVQGKVDTLTRRGTQAEMQMQSVSLVFPNGYIAQAGGAATMESDRWTAANNPSDHAKPWIVLAPMLGSGLGFLIGHAADKPHYTNFGGMTINTDNHRSLFIGGAVGSAAGLATAFTLMGRSHGFYVDAGTPVAMTLPQPVTLTQGQIRDANEKAATQPPPVPVARKIPPIPDTSDHGTCYFPGSPGTPDVVIPGTPAIGDTPGTPPTVIPGIPPSPPTPYPCP